MVFWKKSEVIYIHSGLVVSMLSSQPRGVGFESSAGQRQFRLVSFHAVAHVHLAENRYET